MYLPQPNRPDQSTKTISSNLYPDKNEATSDSRSAKTRASTFTILISTRPSPKVLHGSSPKKKNTKTTNLLSMSSAQNIRSWNKTHRLKWKPLSLWNPLSRIRSECPNPGPWCLLLLISPKITPSSVPAIPRLLVSSTKPKSKQPGTSRRMICVSYKLNMMRKATPKDFFQTREDLWTLIDKKNESQT